MTDYVPEQLSDDELTALAKAARLDLSTERQAAIAPALNAILQLFDALDSVDLGETPPTNSFDPRWRDLP